MKHRPFAKLFDSERFGQILVVFRDEADEDDDTGVTSHVDITFEVEELARCTTSLGFTTEKSGRDAFDGFDISKAEAVVENICQQFGLGDKE